MMCLLSCVFGQLSDHLVMKIIKLPLLIHLLCALSEIANGKEQTVYLGCFKDDPEGRLIRHYSKDPKLLNPEICAKDCQDKGFLYAGLRNGDECYCGNQQSILEQQTKSADCDIPCQGYSNKTCGGKMSMILYSVRKSIQGSYLGCYIDDSSRKIKGQFFVNDNPSDGMTPAKCLYLCSQYGFVYAGLQVGEECLCGNQKLIETDKVSDSDCSVACIGDNEKKCGGHWRNSVYSTGYTFQDILNVQNESLYLGCYMDSKERRLNGYLYKTETLLPETCVNLCQRLGYLFAGIQVGSECFCGDSTPAEADKVLKSDCQFPCFGDYSRQCGGRWRNSVYSTGNFNTEIQPTIDQNYTYKGCYKTTTIENGERQDFVFSLTPKICIEFCQRYGLPYAALHAGATCKCLSEIAQTEDLLNDIQCTSKCHGDKTKICGGLDMDSVYETKVSDLILANYTEQYMGCYNEDNLKTNKGYYFTNQDMSVGMCITVCKYYGYLYASVFNGIQCECGDKQDVGKTSDALCNLACPLNANTKCGGTQKESVYMTGNIGPEPKVADFGVEYFGCFKYYLKYLELRLFIYDYKDQLDPKKCVNRCLLLGFQYAGLLAGSQCLCGNKEPYSGFKVSDKKCNSRCTGEKTSICGGHSRVTVYKSIIESVHSNVDIRNSYIGCYRDQEDRTMKGFFQNMGKLTPWKCVKECRRRNFLYAGVQAGSDCYCSDAHPLDSKQLPQTSCSTDCSGDPLRFCGGNWANAVYHTGNIGKGTYLGCYKDENNEKLKGQYFVMDSPQDGMSQAKCYQLCSKYKFFYAGLQAGVECYCGNEVLVEADKVSDSECNIPCVVKNSGYCGGNKRKLVFITGYTLQETQRPVMGSQYLGCYMDNGERRFKGFFLKNETLLPETCVNLCAQLGYLYAGIQVGSECFCGDTAPADTDKVGDGDCQFPCIGDYSRQCGGRWRNSVYSTGIVGTGIESTVDPNYTYKGCYKTAMEAGKEQDFGFGLTPKICIEFCQRYGLPYAALYAGTECKCLSEIPPARRLLDNNQCITKCPGDKTKTCGGQEMYSVYETGFSEIVLADYSSQHVGCYNENKHNLSNGYQFTSQDMSVGLCITVCKYYGYLYAGLSNGNHCECGDKEDTDKTLDESCILVSLPCLGEPNNKCGGHQKKAIFRTGNIGTEPRIANIGTEHIGCFSDDIKYSELRAYIYDYQDQLDPNKCADQCSRLGFKYTGLLAGSQCLCGNDEPYSGFMVSGSECNTRCTGDKASICGGNSKVTVYKSSAQSVYDEIDIRSHYLGCFRDQGDPRSLRGSFKHMYKLTPWKCVKECKEKNYLYAGLQVGSECYCGDQHPQPSQRLPQKSCFFDCFGDMFRFCGGNWANTIYHTGRTGIEAKIAEIGYRYLGCYRDQENPHQLSSYFTNLVDSLTPLTCVELCKKRGYYYAGLQYGDKCYCGDNHPIPLDLVSQHECNSKCTGDVTKLCGGNRRNLVYITGNSEMASVENKDFQYLGCYKDEELQRHLQGFSQNYGEELTPNKCIMLCKHRGYLYSGLQNSSFCYCGDQYPSPSNKVDDSQCNSRCTGDTSKICGGILRNTIYATGYSVSGSKGAVVADVGYQYIGCFTKKSPIQLSGTSIHFKDSLTPQKCVSFCKEAGHLYCGLYYSTWCYCGDSSPSQSDKVPEGECSSKCLGDVSKICGGPAAFTGYITAKALGDLELQSKDKCTTSETIVNGGQTCSGSVVFEDTFSKPLSTEKWNHIVEFAEEPDYPFVVYNSDRTNSYTASSKLVIKPSILPQNLVRHGQLNLSGCTSKKQSKCSKNAKSYLILPPVQTACLTTSNSFSFRYGKVEIIAKLPVGDWITPDNLIFFIDGEETRPVLPKAETSLSSYLGFTDDISSLWRFGSKIAPFDTEFYLHLGLSVGGIRHFPDNVVNSGRNKPWINKELRSMLNFWRAQKDWESTWVGGAALEVEYIKVTSL